MTQEEKQLLLTDLCARLPYGVRARFCDGVKEETDDVWDIDMFSGAINADYIIDDVKPYLRSMSNMTSEEKNTFEFFVTCNTSDTLDSISWANIQNLSIVRDSCDFIDWLNAHHFDYRGLIPMGLALEAPEDMYKEE